MSAISTQNAAQALYEGSKGKEGKDLEIFLSNGVEFLSKRHLLSKAPEILKSLEELIDHDEGVLRARAETARPLSTETEEDLKNQLKERYGMKEIYLDISINENNIGGMKIQIGDEIIDMTMKHRITQLEDYLIRN
ncbi:MAG: F0F1 ATP synthase subunit delta [Patescibacteria group bacterium]